MVCDPTTGDECPNVLLFKLAGFPVTSDFVSMVGLLSCLAFLLFIIWDAFKDGRLR